MKLVIREIDEADLPAVTAILHEGFPRRSLDYWQAAIELLRRRRDVPGFPRFGFVIDAENGIQGVILLLTADLGNGPRANLSGWYVRPAYRKLAAFLFQRALETKASVFLNLSPSDRGLPIALAFGFKPYTAGVMRLDVRAALRKSSGHVNPVRRGALASLPGSLRVVVETHLDYGCAGLELRDATGGGVALYRIRLLKGIIPCAQFVFGDPARLVALSSPLMRALLRRRIPVALIDSDGTEKPIVGRFMKGREIRYLRGPTAPPIGDLLETELAIFGP